MTSIRGIKWGINKSVEITEPRKQLVRTNHVSRKPQSASSRSNSLTISSGKNRINTASKACSSRIRNLANNERARVFYQSISKLRSIQHSSRSLTIIECAQEASLVKNRKNKLNLSQTLQKVHPFFCKLDKTICESIILLSKSVTYRPKKLLTFQDYCVSSLHDVQVITLKPKQHYVGFIIYGKVELMNPVYFYSHIMNQMTNMGNLNSTIFQHNYIREKDKSLYPYDVRIIEETQILWISKDVMYLIRKECFLNMDLKYKFHEFQNFLKFALIHKKAKLSNK